MFFFFTKKMGSKEKIVNIVYDAAWIAGLSVGYTMVAKNVIKMKPADLGRIDLTDSAKLVAIVSAAVATKNFLVAKQIIPEDIDM